MPARRPRRVAGDRDKLQTLVALKAGNSVYGAAKAAGVTPATVRRWRDQARAQGETFPPPPGESPGDPVNPQTKAWISPLPPGEVDRHLAIYMGEALEALHVQISLLADREWLQEQSADDVAVAHGVCFRQTQPPRRRGQQRRRRKRERSRCSGPWPSPTNPRAPIGPICWTA